ncbi:MAG: DUF4956 domain-containing protein [Oscillibacter sp.]|nr:DUF4956 domain-containing protein [Oscillibacter sp.]
MREMLIGTLTLSGPQIAMIVLLSLVLGAFIWIVYAVSYKGVLFSPTFGLSLMAVTMITAVLILAVSSRIGLSQGLVGALSIVRFRTAIKDPMDVVFLFWAVEAGVTINAGLLPAALVNLAIGLIILAASFLTSLGGKPVIISVRCETDKISRMESYIKEKLSRQCKRLEIKSECVLGDLKPAEEAAGTQPKVGPETLSAGQPDGNGTQHDETIGVNTETANPLAPANPTTKEETERDKPRHNGHGGSFRTKRDNHGESENSAVVEFELVYEARVKDEAHGHLVADEIRSIPGVKNVVCVTYNGDYV